MKYPTLFMNSELCRKYPTNKKKKNPTWSIFQRLDVQTTWPPISFLPYIIKSMTYCCWVHRARYIFSLCVTWIALVLCWRLSQCYNRETFLDTPDRKRTKRMSRSSLGGRWLYAVRMCSRRGALCHLCCSPGRKEECEHQSGNRQSFQFGTSPLTQIIEWVQ